MVEILNIVTSKYIEQEVGCRIVFYFLKHLII